MTRTHADTLRGMASDEHILAGRESPRSTALLAGAEALDTLAADTLEYGVEDANGDEDIVWFPVDATVGTAEDARMSAVNFAASDQFFRLVARRVSEPWEVE